MSGPDRLRLDQPTPEVRAVVVELAVLMSDDAPADSGDDVGPRLYPDAVAALQAWAEDRRALYVYARQSVAEQKHTVADSDHGDLTALFSGYFDPAIGARTDSESYTRIAGILGEGPASLLCVSGAGDALDAAAAAGLQTCWVARDPATQDKAASSETHPAVASFDDIELL